MTKVRSPNYPSISLPEAITRVRAVYEKEHRHVTSKEVIVGAMGYTSLNGASTSVLSALAKYGLLESVGDQYRVSKEAQDVLVHRKGDPEYEAGIRRLALRPPLFDELFDLYGDSLPSDHTIRTYLITKKEFNPRTVNAAIRSYRDTMEFVKVEAGGLEVPDEADEAPAEVPMQAPFASSNPAVSRGGGGLVPALAMAAAAPDHELVFNLAEDCVARISFIGQVTQEAIEKFVAYLNISKDTYPMRAARQQRDEQTATMET